MMNTNIDELIETDFNMSRDDDDENQSDIEPDYLYNIPVVFHNLRSCDGHLIVKNFKREYTGRILKNGCLV